MATYAKSSKTKERLFKTAFSLFSKNGYGATSLKDIAEAAGVSTGTLYRYFPAKSDFLFQIRREAHDRLYQVAESMPEDLPLSEKLLRVLSEDLRSVSWLLNPSGETKAENRYTELVLALRREPYESLDQLQREESYREELSLICRQLIEQEQRKGRFDASTDAAMLAEIATALYFRTADLSILHCEWDGEEYLEHMLDCLFSAQPSCA